MQDRVPEAEKVLIRLHQRDDDPDHTFARSELYIIKGQIEYEKTTKKPLLQAIRQRSLLKRFAVGFLAIWSTQCSGVIVVLCRLDSKTFLQIAVLTILCSVPVDNLRGSWLLTVRCIYIGRRMVLDEFHRQFHRRYSWRLRRQI